MAQPHCEVCTYQFRTVKHMYLKREREREREKDSKDNEERGTGKKK